MQARTCAPCRGGGWRHVWRAGLLAIVYACGHGSLYLIWKLFCTIESLHGCSPGRGREGAKLAPPRYPGGPLSGCSTWPCHSGHDLTTVSAGSASGLPEPLGRFALRGRSAPSLLAWLVHVPGGRKMQTICFTEPQPRIQACMRLSCDSRRGRFCGTIAVPCFVVTESCGKLPVWTAWATAQLSTGAQSFARQHSSGYQSCASPDVTRLRLLAARMRQAAAGDR